MSIAVVTERSGQSVDLAYSRLRDAILTGKLQAGSIVAQSQISEVTGTSRTPVREALRLLEAEGLVISEPNKRIRIAPMDAQDLENLQIQRIAIEFTGVVLTVPRLSIDDTARLEGLFAEMGHYQRLEDFDRFDVPHRRFHLALVAAMGPTTVKRIGELRDYDRRYRRAFADTPDAAEAFIARHVEHRELLDLAAAGDAVGCARMLALHYGRSPEHIFRELDPSYVPTRLNEVVAFHTS